MAMERQFYSNGNVKSIRLTDEKKNVTLTEFDELGREVRYTHSNGTERNTLYTADGSRSLTWCVHDDGSETVTLTCGDDIKTILLSV